MELVEIAKLLVILGSLLTLIISLFMTMYYGTTVLRELSSGDHRVTPLFVPVALLFPNLFRVHATPVIRRARISIFVFAASLIVLAVAYPFPK